jgi:hypothetical protein
MAEREFYRKPRDALDLARPPVEAATPPERKSFY